MPRRLPPVLRQFRKGQSIPRQRVGRAVLQYILKMRLSAGRAACLQIDRACQNGNQGVIRGGLHGVSRFSRRRRRISPRQQRRRFLRDNERPQSHFRPRAAIQYNEKRREQTAQYATPFLSVESSEGFTFPARGGAAFLSKQILQSKVPCLIASTPESRPAQRVYSPTVRTSASSSRPKRSRTRCLTVSASWWKSAAVACPRFTRKFAWRGETAASPICSPLQPHASDR